MAKAFKLTGTGNHFLLVDLRHDGALQAYAKFNTTKTRAALARTLCNSFQSVGADGLLFLESSDKADLKWDFYNSDGSTAEMCGNAARCVACYIEKISSGKLTEISIETKAGVIRARRARASSTSKTEAEVHTNVLGEYEIDMPDIRIYKPNQSLTFCGKKIRFNFVNSGVPHVVIELSSKLTLQNIITKAADYEELVAKIRKLSQFKKSGTNVTFYTAKSKNHIHTLTFERGVVGFTQACGTGAIAASYCYQQKHYPQLKTANRIVAIVPGGELSILLHTSKPTLIGPAKLIAELDIVMTTSQGQS